MKKKAVIALIRVFVSLSLVGALLYAMRGSYAKLAVIFRSADLFLFFLSLATLFLSISFTAVRLQLLLAAQDIMLSFKETISLTFIGYFFNNFLPSTVGGDIIKAYYASKKSHRLGAFTSVFVDRFIGMLSMIFLALLSVCFAGAIVEDKRFIYLVYGFAGMCLFALLFIANKNFAKKFSFIFVFMRPFEEKLKKFYDVIHTYRHQKEVVFKTLAISFVSQIIYFTGIYILAKGIGTPVPMMQIIFRMPIVAAIALMPSIGGLGVREGAIVVLFSPIIGKESAFALSLLALVMLLGVGVAGGLVYSFSPQFKVDKKVEQETALRSH